MNIEEWKSQIKRGTLEFCILQMIDGQALYGYEIISRLEEWPILAAKESTIYPLLRRLLKEGCLSSYWQETTEGLPPRKYYTITETGRAYLQAMSREWDNLLTAMEAVTQNAGVPLCPENTDVIRKHHKGVPLCPENTDVIRKGG